MCMMIDDETFIPCKYDWSDLEEKINYILDDYENLTSQLSYNLRNLFLDNFTNEKLCLYYYNLFSTLDNVKRDDNVR